MRSTQKAMRCAYECLRAIPPFSTWQLPPASNIHFKVEVGTRYGHWWTLSYKAEDTAHNKNAVHGIAVAHGMSLPQFMATMAHEMLHLAQAINEAPKTDCDWHKTPYFILQTGRLAPLLDLVEIPDDYVW